MVPKNLGLAFENIGSNACSIKKITGDPQGKSFSLLEKLLDRAFVRAKPHSLNSLEKKWGNETKP